MPDLSKVLLSIHVHSLMFVCLVMIERWGHEVRPGFVIIIVVHLYWWFETLIFPSLRFRQHHVVVWSRVVQRIVPPSRKKHSLGNVSLPHKDPVSPRRMMPIINNHSPSVSSFNSSPLICWADPDPHYIQHTNWIFFVASQMIFIITPLISTLCISGEIGSFTCVRKLSSEIEVPS